MIHQADFSQADFYIPKIQNKPKHNLTAVWTQLNQKTASIGKIPRLCLNTETKKYLYSASFRTNLIF